VTYSPPSPDGPCPGTWSPSCTPLPSPPDFGAGGTVTGGNETYVPEPGVIDLSGDGSTAVTGITWQSWGDQQAAATGTYEHDDCVPNCAAGTYSKVPAAITLSDPVPDANAPTGRVWGAMTITYGGQVTTWSYPGEWAQGAS
jgi:hypothetical protein